MRVIVIHDSTGQVLDVFLYENLSRFDVMTLRQRARDVGLRARSCKVSPVESIATFDSILPRATKR